MVEQQQTRGLSSLDFTLVRFSFLAGPPIYLYYCMINGNLKSTSTHNLIVKKRKDKEKPFLKRKKTKCLIKSFE